MQAAIKIARALPDAPRHVETRAMLMRGACSVFGSLEQGVVVVGRNYYLSSVIGQPPAGIMCEAVATMPGHVELLVAHEDVAHVRSLLSPPKWREFPATIHALREPIKPKAPDGSPVPRRTTFDAILFEETNDEIRAHFTDEKLRRIVEYAIMIAAKRIGGEFVSICHTNSITETLWDVGVDTLPAHRRRGWARECYEVLAEHLARRGKQPVWGSLDTNAASLAMAASLGFVPVDRMAIFMRSRR